jgi:NAD+-dependent protein deacetylase sirtuin 5
MCSYKQENNYDVPLSQGLANINETTELQRNIPLDELPICPRCRVGLLRPGVVWFGEALPLQAMSKADEFITSGEVDLILVIGTSGSVWPAAGYIEQVVMRGGKVAIFNIESMQDYEQVNGWIFNGDAADWLPKALEPLIGKLSNKASSG